MSTRQSAASDWAAIAVARALQDIAAALLAEEEQQHIVSASGFCDRAHELEVS